MNTHNNPHIYVRKLVAMLLAGTLVAAACSSETEETSTTVAPSTTAGTAETLQDVLDRATADDAIPAIGATVFTSTDLSEQAISGV